MPSTSGVTVDEQTRRAAKDMNLSVLRRLDPAVIGVVTSATQVAVYHLPEDSPDKQWCRSGIDGSLFVVARKVEGDGAAYRVVVVNRRHPKNFVDDIVPGLDFDQTDQMIMFKNNQNVVSGLWFFVPSEMPEVLNVMSLIVKGQYPPPRTLLKTNSPILGGSRPGFDSTADDKDTKDAAAVAHNSMPSASSASPPKPGTTNSVPSNPGSNPGGPCGSPAASSEHAVATSAVSGAVPVKPFEPATGNDPSAPDNVLAKFFPNMKLTNGVAGSAPPPSATRLADAEAVPVLVRTTGFAAGSSISPPQRRSEEQQQGAAEKSASTGAQSIAVPHHPQLGMSGHIGADPVNREHVGVAQTHVSQVQSPPASVPPMSTFSHPHGLMLASNLSHLEMQHRSLTQEVHAITHQLRQNSGASGEAIRKSHMLLNAKGEELQRVVVQIRQTRHQMFLAHRSAVPPHPAMAHGSPPLMYGPPSMGHGGAVSSLGPLPMVAHVGQTPAMPGKESDPGMAQMGMQGPEVGVAPDVALALAATCGTSMGLSSMGGAGDMNEMQFRSLLMTLLSDPRLFKVAHGAYCSTKRRDK